MEILIMVLIYMNFIQLYGVFFFFFLNIIYRICVGFVLQTNLTIPIIYKYTAKIKGKILDYYYYYFIF